MILKSFEIKKIDQTINHLILFYGKNEGLKNEALNILVKNENEFLKYEEKEILENENNFIENIFYSFTVFKISFRKVKFFVSF